MRKSAVLWDMTPYSPVEVYRCFGGTYCLHLQGPKTWKSSMISNIKFDPNIFYDGAGNNTWINDQGTMV
jgi:hypothetical protein